MSSSLDITYDGESFTKNLRQAFESRRGEDENVPEEEIVFETVDAVVSPGEYSLPQAAYYLETLVNTAHISVMYGEHVTEDTPSEEPLNAVAVAVEKFARGYLHAVYDINARDGDTQSHPEADSLEFDPAELADEFDAVLDDVIDVPIAETTTFDDWNERQDHIDAATDQFHEVSAGWPWTKTALFIEYALSEQSPVNGGEPINFDMPDEQFRSLQYTDDDILSGLFHSFGYWTIDSILNAITVLDDLDPNEGD